MWTSSITIAVAALATFGQAAPLENRAPTCVSGVYMIVARGTNEPAGQGKSGQVAKLVADQVPNSASVAVNYPATALKKRDLYPISVTKGIKDTINKIHDYVAACGDKSRIVLIGYSQGGNVITDVLAGGVLKPAPLEDRYRKYSQYFFVSFESLKTNPFVLVTAVTVFGDPAFAINQSYNVGTNSNGENGIFSRASNDGGLALLNRYAGKLADYCDEGDVYCASGDDTAVHGQTVGKYAQAAADFIIARANQRKKMKKACMNSVYKKCKI